MTKKIVIVDYGMGNIHSVVKKIKKLNGSVTVSSSPIEILESDKIILAGVGHFQKAMENLEQLKLIDVLDQVAFHQKKPILGICLGMQLMSKTSEEGTGVNGLGWVEASVKKIKVDDTIKYKVPHMGWNKITIKKKSTLMKGVCNDDKFYFAHSYYMDVQNTNLILNETEYSFKFVSAIEQGNIYGVQYHPEKSHDAGAILLSNFVKM
jgi:glutamine amidotransferase